MVFYRKNSRKLSYSEITKLPQDKNQWNSPYPLIEPQRPELKHKMPNTINVGLFGHVDTGKSTLLGHLFYKLKIVKEKTIRKNEREAKKIGKAKFKYAWVMDEMEEER